MVWLLSASLRKPSRTRAMMRRGVKSMYMERGQVPEQVPHWMQDQIRSQPGCLLISSAHPGSASRWNFIFLLMSASNL